MIERDPVAAARPPHDLVVVGGGIHGSMLALEAARRGLDPLLLEKADFGGGTSWNSLRIAHGGLRYLQTLDLERFRESVRERRWLLRRFPDLVEPLPCLMPLYGRGLRRPAVFRVALLLNRLLSRDRNRGVEPDRRLPPGRVLDAAETRARVPAVREEGLQGGALWYDASIRSTNRLLIEALRWACARGARCLNYVEARELLVEDGAVAGVRGRDRARNEDLSFRARVVVNAAGPWTPAVARAFGSPAPGLYTPSIAFNLLLDREPPSDVCVAVEPEDGGRTYFLRPWRGRLLAGTWHGPWDGGPDGADPGEERIGAFLEDLRRCAPALDVSREEVVRVYAGLLPAEEEGTAELSTREVLHDHGADGGPAGLYSLAGVKYTTARRVAERALRRIYGERLPGIAGRGRSVAGGRPAVDPERARLWEDGRALELHRRDPERLRRFAIRLGREEAVVTLDDLLLRRTDWWMDAREAPEVATFLRRVLGEAGLSRGPEAGRPRTGREGPPS